MMIIMCIEMKRIGAWTDRCSFHDTVSAYLAGTQKIFSVSVFGV